MIKKIKFISIVLAIIFSFSLIGCSKIDKMKLKMGMKNNDFEYIKQGKINTAIIQNRRDKGFTFKITDKEAIQDLYNILSKAKEVKNKINLEPDYILEFREGVDKVHKFSYVAGLDKKDAGNLYGDNKIYIVSKRLDDDIMKNFWNIRVPNNFKEVYYNSMTNAIEDYRKTLGNNKKIGIDIHDEEVTKFILTMDLEEFKGKLGKNEEVIKDDDRNRYDVTMDIQTEGYKTDIYKCIIAFYDKANKEETKYYFINKYSLNSWEFSFTKNKKPEEF